MHIKEEKEEKHGMMANSQIVPKKLKMIFSNPDLYLLHNLCLLVTTSEDDLNERDHLVMKHSNENS